MLQHVYPPWHKPVQRVLFVVAAVLCITLPVLYGRHRSISSSVLGTVLGLYFGCWLLFSLMVRFLIPSPRTESTLPVHNPSPIPTPVMFYSPNRSDALPASPAIRLPSVALVDEKQPQRGARFAPEIEDSDDDDDSSTQGARHLQHSSNNVTFQTRPRGNTTDSLTYPTFAAYRQAQHVNFDAFAQRVKKAFALKQDQERREREEEKLVLQQLQLQEEQAAAAAAAAAASMTSLQLQHRLLRPGNSRSQSSSMVPPASNSAKSSGTRSRSSSAAGMIGDFAERIKSGSSLFFRRSSSSFGIVTSNDSGAASGGGNSSMAKTASATTLAPVVHPVTGYHDAPEPSAHNGAAPTTQTTTVERQIEIRVTRSSLSGDDHP